MDENKLYPTSQIYTIALRRGYSSIKVSQTLSSFAMSNVSLQFMLSSFFS